MARHSEHPCRFCASRHEHFSVWVPLTWRETGMLLFAAVLLGFMVGWVGLLELQRHFPLPSLTKEPRCPTTM